MCFNRLVAGCGAGDIPRPTRVSLFYAGYEREVDGECCHKYCSCYSIYGVVYTSSSGAVSYNRLIVHRARYAYLYLYEALGYAVGRLYDLGSI